MEVRAAQRSATADRLNAVRAGRDARVADDGYGSGLEGESKRVGSELGDNDWLVWIAGASFIDEALMAMPPVQGKA